MKLEKRFPFRRFAWIAAVPFLAWTALGNTPAGEPRPAPASFRFAPPAVAKPTADAAPLRLTAADGSGLTLVALDVRGVLEPPLAFTELRMTFENPEDRIREGRFRITLPPRAVLSRFAMKIDGHWQEGEIVERQRARTIYEDFLHRRQDPALLEQQAGNEFSARVFPIPARGTKELVVSYSHALERSDEPYVVPLHGLPEIGRLDVRVLLGERTHDDNDETNLGGTVSDRRLVELHRSGWTPDRDLVVRQDEVADRLGLRHRNLAVFRVRPDVEATSQSARVEALTLLVDTSASRALGFKRQVDLAAALVAGLRDGNGPRTPVRVLAFDQDVTPIYEGPAEAFGPRHQRQLLERGALGASDLHRALDQLADRLAERDAKSPPPRVLVLTDGVATAGETDVARLREAVAALGEVGVTRLDVLALGGLRDDTVLRQLVAGNLARDGQVLDAAMPLPEIGRRLTRTTRSGIKVEVEGAQWVWPRTLDSVQPGDERLVYAELSKPARPVLRLDGRPVDFGERGLVDVERPLLERACVASRMERLLHLRDTDFAGDLDVRRGLVKEVTELSVRHRVLSPFTALLVLETERDYERYGLDRRSLGEILTVGLGGLEVVGRQPPAATAAAPSEVKGDGDTRRLLTEGDGDTQRLLTGGANDFSETPLDVRPEEPVTDDTEEDIGNLEIDLQGGLPSGRVPAFQGNLEIVSENAALDALQEEAAALEEELRRLDEGDHMIREEIAVRAPHPVGDGRMRLQEAEVQQGRDVPKYAAPYEGPYADVMAALARGSVADARQRAEQWWASSPGDVLALLALGESAAAAGDVERAARAYGSLIDLFPSRADLRRHAGQRLASLSSAAARRLAVDTYAKAADQRPDHLSGHRLLAWALVREERYAEAFAALERGLTEESRDRRGVRQVLLEDLGLVATLWQHAEGQHAEGQHAAGDREEEIRERLGAQGANWSDRPSLRFVLSWETDANDVDLHIFDRKGAHASYANMTLPSGGTLIADVTNGYGPEAFVIPLPARQRATPYRLGAHYYSRGPMGYGMGTLQVIEHDGMGGVTIDERPFVVMVEQSYVELGEYGKKLSGR